MKYIRSKSRNSRQPKAWFSLTPPPQQTPPDKSIAHLHPHSQAEQLPNLSLHNLSGYINNSLSVYLFLDTKSQLGKSKEFNNQGMKVQVKKAFKSYSFFGTKKTIKNRQAPHEFFSSNNSYSSFASTPHFKVNSPLLLPPTPPWMGNFELLTVTPGRGNQSFR